VQGATAVIDQSHPAWLIELSDHPDTAGTNAGATCKLLTDAGYSTYWFDGNRLRSYQPGDESVNYFFLMPEHLVGLKQAGLSVAD
jgi:hypothetical protein